MTKHELKIHPSVDSNDIEKYLARSDLGNCDLVLPLKINWGGTVGQSASIAQFIATWAHNCDSPNLKLNVSQDDSHKLKGLVSRLHGLSGVYFSECVQEVKMSSDIRYNMLVHAVDRFIAMWQRDYLNVAKGRKIELISVVGAKREFLPVFYKRQPTINDLFDREKHGRLIVSPEEMTSLFDSCIKSVKVPIASIRQFSKQKIANSIGVLLYEAFRNTAEHAYLNELGEIPAKGLRCVLIDYVEIGANEIQDINPLSRSSNEQYVYFDNIATRQRKANRKKVFFVEISILDSGPGFASSMNNSSDTTSDVASVMSCFEKHRSRKSGDFSGLGLPRILAAVQELNGFIRFRTSTCEASYFASDENRTESNIVPQVESKLAQVVGTLITVCFPVTY